MTTIGCHLCEPAWSSMRTKERLFYALYARWDLGQIVPVTTETPIKRMASLRVSPKFRQNPSNVKVMVILVYDCNGVILKHTVPPKQTINA
ncbi:hypothetical protein TNCV_2318581 [Trichonephila clavipes]|nr:hypothetical protein TNCV_2318581 [Trichonephila clavipes]